MAIVEERITLAWNIFGEKMPKLTIRVCFAATPLDAAVYRYKSIDVLEQLDPSLQLIVTFCSTVQVSDEVGDKNTTCPDEPEKRRKRRKKKTGTNARVGQQF